MKSNIVRTTLIILAASVVTTLGIFASDISRGVKGGIGNLAQIGSAEVCPQGTILITKGEHGFCADVYEASPGTECPAPSPQNILESEKNTNTASCYAASVKGAAPWTFISLTQAQRVCSSAGKRLPTADEWYTLALGTEALKCVVKSTAPGKTGTDACVSNAGMYDVVGNVWEWVDETVVGTTYDNRPLPEEGYVTSVDANGVAITSAAAPDDLYGRDYVWSKAEGVFGMIRGGFYGSDSDAGLYTVNASVPTNFASQGVGFRCVMDIK